MPHPYSAWLAPRTKIYGSHPDYGNPTEGNIPTDTYVLITYPFPARGEFYVNADVKQMRQVLSPDGVKRIPETNAGDVDLYEHCIIYVHKDIVTRGSHVHPPELSTPTFMERLL